MAYTKYSLTPSSNTAAPPDGAPEGMLPSAVNDTMRDMMAQIRDCGDGIRDGTYTMTAPKITGGTITGSTINNSAIGGTTATTGKFTTLEATGVATFSAGAVGTPAITTTGDTNTGIFFPAADTIAFTEGGVEAMRINSSGGVKAVNCISVGNTTPSTDGSGITFPATQSASTDSNTLDDYEEGSWTPTMVFSGGAGTLSYGTQDGFYTKIGRTVYFSMRLVFSKGTASGTLDSISGLPFSATSTNGGGVYIDGMNSLAGAAQYIAQSTTFYVYMSTTGNAASINAASMAASNNVLAVSGFYIT